MTGFHVSVYSTAGPLGFNPIKSYDQANMMFSY